MKENRYKHTKCYINKELGKGIDIDTIDCKIELVKQQMEIDRKAKKEKELEKQKVKLKNKKNKIIEDKYKNDLIKWFFDNYNITNIDRYFYSKLANVNNGTFKGLSEGISYEDLLYMFQTKKSELNDIAAYKEKTGTGFKNDMKRLHYDLAVIINKYDSYKRWKEKQKLIEVKRENTEKYKDINIHTNQASKIRDINRKNQEDNEIDIDDILDDIL